MGDWVRELKHAGSTSPSPGSRRPSSRTSADVAGASSRDYAYADGATTITIPAGFEFDLSSVPRAFWWLIAPFELSITAPLVHDFLYQHRGDPPAGAVDPARKYTRAEADRLFRRIMEQEGVADWRRVLGYAGVRLFGRGDW